MPTRHLYEYNLPVADWNQTKLDAEQLRRLGVHRVVTPKTYSLTGIMGEFVDVVREANGLSVDGAAASPAPVAGS